MKNLVNLEIEYVLFVKLIVSVLLVSLSFEHASAHSYSGQVSVEFLFGRFPICLPFGSEYLALVILCLFSSWSSHCLLQCANRWLVTILILANILTKIFLRWYTFTVDFGCLYFCWLSFNRVHMWKCLG